MMNVIDILTIVMNLCKDVDFPAPCMDNYLKCSETYYSDKTKKYSPDTRKCFTLNNSKKLKKDKE
jgi:hypothetical protein